MLNDAIQRIAEGECVIDPTIVSRHLGVTTDAYEAALRDVFAKLGLSGTQDDLRRVGAVLGYLRSTR